MPVAGVMAAPQLRVVYPPPQHTTTAPQIFFIGTAPPEMPVTINGVPVGDRSPAGHFAPSVPLQPGVNRITVTAGKQVLAFTITRAVAAPPRPSSRWSQRWIWCASPTILFASQQPPRPIVP
ncbi:hypothetical protein [Parathermosynechococcus lividus]|uniref:hypothetical protein n=1 Tax=Parathermosynechococcus lividus TaxID=33070 RepID=UPI001D0D61CF|nr:hypothetical protein [Thermostichus lividus]